MNRFLAMLFAVLCLAAPAAALPPTDAAFVELCKAGDAEAVRQALAEGANVHAADAFGRTTLMWAAHHGHLEAAEILLAAGARVNATTGNGYTALMKAAESGNAALVERLLSAGAEVNAKNRYGRTALMQGASNPR